MVLTLCSRKTKVSQLNSYVVDMRPSKGRDGRSVSGARGRVIVVVFLGDLLNIAEPFVRDSGTGKKEMIRARQSIWTPSKLR